MLYSNHIIGLRTGECLTASFLKPEDGLNADSETENIIRVTRTGIIFGFSIKKCFNLLKEQEYMSCPFLFGSQ
jgi:hypothetical protein